MGVKHWGIQGRGQKGSGDAIILKGGGQDLNLEGGGDKPKKKSLHFQAEKQLKSKGKKGKCPHNPCLPHPLPPLQKGHVPPPPPPPNKKGLGGRWWLEKNIFSDFFFSSLFSDCSAQTFFLANKQ